MEEHKLDQEEGRIDLYRLLPELGRALRRLFWVPLLLALLGAAAMGVRAWRSYVPLYHSEGTFTIETSASALSDMAGSGSYYDKATAEQLAKTFPYLLQSDLLQSLLRQELGVSWLNGSISARAVDNTSLFSLRVTSTSAQDAYDILETVIRIYPRVADYVVGSTEMHILTQPAVAAQPDAPFDPVRSICKGALLGLALGLAVVLLFAATRRTVRTPEEVKRRLNQTCLASLPAVRFKRRSGQFDRTISIQNPRISGAFLENVRSLRIKFLRAAEGRKVIMVSSTLPGEGKTTVAVNLALTLSQNGARVILVDLDLRKPSVKHCLGVSVPSRGAPELLNLRGADPREHLLTLEGTQVRLLAGDEPSSNPRRQMESRRLEALLTTLREEADYVILDTPPCGLLGDGAALAGLADASLYVVRSGTAQVSHILDSLQFLAGSGTPLMGCVLNGASGGGGRYGYGYGYGYGGDHYGKYHAYRQEK